VPAASPPALAAVKLNDLRAPGAVLLVSCYELGHQPMGLASPLAALKAAGLAPAALDYAVDGFDGEKVRGARFIGISVPMHTALRLGLRFAERAREINPDCFLCFYGLYAQLNAEYLYERGADAVLGGEYEQALLDLTTHHSPLTTQHSPPIPSRDQLPSLDRYARLEWNGEHRLAGYVESTRGCKHLCTHCPIPPVYHGRFTVVSADAVLADIRRQVASGAAHITFGDADFLNGPGHALRIARALHAEFPTLTFDFTAKIEHLVKHRGLLPDLGAMGCLFIVSAVESLHPEVLRHLRKGHSREEATEAVHLARAAGITLRPSLVPFTPWETLESYIELLEWVAREELIEAVDPVHYSIRLLIPPGSLLLDSPAMIEHLDGLDRAALSYRWRHPDARMSHLQEQVAVVVEAAEAAREPYGSTFSRVRDLAYAALGEAPPPLPERAEPVVKPPRLTESWFC